MRTTARSYSHKSFGHIGAATIQSPDGEWTLNGKTLSEKSVDHLLTFALQTLQDAYAGAKSDDDARALWEKKLGKIMEGTIGTRVAGGSKASDETRHMRRILRDSVAAEFTKLAWKTMDEDERVEAIDEAYANLDADDAATVDAMIDEAIAAEKAKKGLAIKVKIAKK